MQGEMVDMWRSVSQILGEYLEYFITENNNGIEEIEDRQSFANHCYFTLLKILVNSFQ